MARNGKGNYMLRAHRDAQGAEEMTKRQAIVVLIREARRRLRGAGQGLTEIPSAAERKEIVAALRKVWRDAYNFDPSPTDLEGW